MELHRRVGVRRSWQIKTSDIWYPGYWDQQIYGKQASNQAQTFQAPWKIQRFCTTLHESKSIIIQCPITFPFDSNKMYFKAVTTNTTTTLQWNINISYVISSCLLSTLTITFRVGDLTHKKIHIFCKNAEVEGTNFPCSIIGLPPPSDQSRCKSSQAQ